MKGFYGTIIIFALVANAVPTSCNAQKVSELKKKLVGANDTTKANTYYSISTRYWNVNSDSVIFYANLSLELSKKKNFKKGLAHAFLSKGVAHDTRGEYLKALDYHIQALKIAEEENLPGLKANCYSNIGIVYFSLKDYPKALAYFEKGFAIQKKIAKERDLVPAYINLGDLHLQLKNYAQAILYNSKGLEIASANKDSLSVTTALYNLGDTYLKSNELEKAQDYFEKSLLISRKINDPEGILLCVASLAKVNLGKGNFAKSKQLVDSAQTMAQRMNRRDIMVDVYNILYENYLATGMMAKAIEYSNREIALRDSLINTETKKQIENIQAQYELGKKQNELNIQQSEIAFGKKLRWLYAISLSVFFLLIVYLFWLSYKRRKLNNSLLEQNEFIHNLHEEVRKQNQELTILNGVKTKLMSIIGHDVRSPLNNLKAIMDLLHTENLSSDEFKILGVKLSEQLNTTVSFVENLLYWAKSQMEGEHTNPESFSLATLAESVIALVKPGADEKGVRLINSISQEQNVYADRAMVEIILRNLITNAIKFSKTDGEVTLSATPKANQLSICVKDNGIGMTMGQIASLFESSVASIRGTSQERGTGLGLLLCKDLVEKNNGSISVTSEPQKGSTFTFVLPIS